MTKFWSELTEFFNNLVIIDQAKSSSAQSWDVRAGRCSAFLSIYNGALANED